MVFARVPFTLTTCPDRLTFLVIFTLQDGVCQGSLHSHHTSRPSDLPPSDLQQRVIPLSNYYLTSTSGLVARSCSLIVHNISEVSKGDCIIMGDFDHGNIKWDTLQSTGVEDSTFLCLVEDNFLTQHVLEPTRATRVLNIVLSSQKELVDNVEIKELLGSSDHNQMHFNINIKSDKTKVKQCRRDFRKGNYKDILEKFSTYRLE